jgi:predicted KAP-like P-loop ATPase
MQTKDKYGYSAHRAISKIEDDLLGRAEFSKNLSVAISQWKGQDSLVIALYGDWGTGKSSIKNMAILYLKEQNSPPTIIEFSPWEWSAQEKITHAFFDEISKSIGKLNLSENDKKLANIFKKYGNYLAASESIFHGTSVALPIIVSIVAALGISTSLLVHDAQDALIITAILSFVTSLIGISKWGAQKLNQLASFYENRSKSKEKTLDDIRTELKDELLRREEPLLIVIDDLDRLTTQELRMIFQLVKANTDFPNVTFLLLFQKDIVEKKLTDESQLGKDYLEKIIQIPFYTPKLEHSKIEKVLFNRLDSIINSHSNVNFDAKRWANIYHAGLKFYFHNLRNVYRFTSSLAFQFSLFSGRKTFEVNTVDLIAIECLRIFESEAIKELSNSSKAFTTFKATSSSSTYEKENFNRQIEGVIDKVSIDRKNQFKSIIIELFPTTEWILNNTYYPSEIYSNWFTDLRVCHPKHFEKYFRLSLAENEFSASNFKAFLELCSNRKKLEERILDLNTSGSLKEFLSQFESYSDQVPTSSFQEYLYALLDTADKVFEKTSGFMDIFSAQTHIFRLISFCLNRIEDKTERADLIINYMCHNKGLNSVAKLLNSEENKISEGKETLFENSDFNFIKTEFIRNIKDTSYKEPSSLLEYNSFLSLMYSWSKWGNKKDVQDWLNSMTTDITAMINVLSKFIQTSHVYTSGDYTSSQHSSIKIDTVEEFFEISKIQELIKSADLSLLSDNEREIITMFNKGIENKVNGIDDDF